MLEKERLEWIKHVIKMNHGRLLKKMFESKAGGIRRKERPGLRWLEDVEKNLR